MSLSYFVHIFYYLNYKNLKFNIEENLKLLQYFVHINCIDKLCTLCTYILHVNTQIT